VSGVLAALWLLGLLAAAPLWRTSNRYDLADRLRDALVLGVAIPFALGLVHLLFPIACWIALGICIALAYRKREFEAGAATQSAAVTPPYLLVAALLLVAWPQLVRPLLDGDSLSYHLPNAAAWAQAHSLWTTTTHYWWYPPASELFAGGLYAVSGPFALPWSGCAALALLGFRIVTWARESFASPIFADALAAATVTAFPLAIQGGTLQNDVWLAAFWLEALWSLRVRPARPPAARALAITALIKPQGWLFAAIALFASRARATTWIAAFSLLGLWAMHDAILWGTTAPSASNASYGELLHSTILAHGVGALRMLAVVALRISPFALLALAAALLGPALNSGALGWAACAAAVLFLVLPYGYETNVAQLATGASLRFAAPAIAAGGLLLGLLARRLAAIGVALLLASTLYGCWLVLSIFWNDGSTHVALAVAALGVAIAALASRSRARWAGALALGLAVVLATHLAARHPLDYYDDALAINGSVPGVYRWIERARPAAVGGWGLRAGVVNVLSPQTRTLDLGDADPCVQARLSRVLLVAVAQSDLPPESNARRLRVASGCGRVVYRDAIAVVAAP
jgi:hypothetical protein